MIEKAIANWHLYLRRELSGGADELLHEDCVFYSPVVFTPQKGREITKLYLEAAREALPGEKVDKTNSGGGDGSFRYTKKILMGNQAALEFETTVDGKSVNGIDIITCDDAGKITEFRVMIRPLQAVNAVHRQMKAMLETLQS
jgi:hypothetical protein